MSPANRAPYSPVEGRIMTIALNSVKHFCEVRAEIGGVALKA